MILLTSVMKRHLLVLTLLAFSFSANGQNPFSGTLKPGEFYTGFKTMGIRDSTRLYDNHDRPLLLSVWYPTNQKSDNPLNYEDYLFVDSQKKTFLTPDQAQKDSVKSNFISSIIKRGASEDHLQSLLKMETMAYLGTAPVQGNGALVVVAQGGGRPASTQFIMNEFLASHGYVVISFADIYASSNRQQNSALLNMEALSADIKLAIDHINANYQYQLNSIGIIGFSRAGDAIVNLLSQAYRFNAFVGMDAHPRADLVTKMPSHGLQTIQTPTLAFFSNHQKKMTYDEAVKDTIAFQFLPNSKKTKVRLMESNHGDQTSAGMIAGNIVKNFNRWPLIGNAQLGYETICRMTLNFFDKHSLNYQPDTDIINNPQEALSLPGEFIVVHHLKKP